MTDTDSLECSDYYNGRAVLSIYIYPSTLTGMGAQRCQTATTRSSPIVRIRCICPDSSGFTKASFPVTADSLLKFLGEHQHIMSLDILRVSIPNEDRWNIVLRYINTNMPALESLAHSALGKNGRFVELDRRPGVNNKFMRAWKWGDESFAHSCPSDCDSWPGVHKSLVA